MRPGETIATYDVGLALRGKTGRFEITSPTGEIYDVICKANHSTSKLEWSSDGNENSPFFIRKFAEGALLAEAKATTTRIAEEENQSSSSSLPYVVDQAVDGEPPSQAGVIELLYLEDNLETGQPSACVYLKGDYPDALDGHPAMTSRCPTFNELDSEIRRLQAQLDEIHSRAKKMFYKTQSFAASA